MSTMPPYLRKRRQIMQTRTPSPLPGRLPAVLLLILCLVRPVAAQFYWSSGFRPTNESQTELDRLVRGGYADDEKQRQRTFYRGELARLEKAGVAAQTDPDAQDDYAVLLFMSGRDPEAERIWQALLGREPGRISTLLNLATARQMRGRMDEARAFTARALAVNPDLRAGAEQMRLRMLDFLAAVRRNPAYSREHLFLDELLPAWKARKRPPATLADVRLTTAPVEALAGLLQAFPSFGDGWMNLGMILENRGDFQRARLAYNQALKYGNGQAESLRPYATALAEFVSSRNPVRVAGRGMLTLVGLVLGLLLVGGLLKLVRAMAADRRESAEFRERMEREAKKKRQPEIHRSRDLG